MFIPSAFLYKVWLLLVTLVVICSFLIPSGPVLYQQDQVSSHLSPYSYSAVSQLPEALPIFSKSEENFREKQQKRDSKIRAISPWSVNASREFRSFVEPAMGKLEIPGAAVAIVQNGAVVFSEGFGVQGLGHTKGVTSKTQFLTGSISKPLTGLMIANLVDKKILDWSTLITDLMPDLKVGSPQLTRQLRLNHTLCACSGLPSRNMEVFFHYSEVTPENRLLELQQYLPVGRLEGEFLYSNAPVALGGYAAAKACYPNEPLQTAYEKCLHETVFDPLKMSRSGLQPQRGVSEDFAYPHAFDFKGELSEIELELEKAVSTIAPAGGVWSSVEDLSQYLIFELGQLRLDKARRGSPSKAVLARRNRITHLNQDAFYGLGLFVAGQRGYEIVWHPGGTLGYSSYLFFLPELDLGAVVVTNQGGDNPLLLAVREKILDLVVGRENANNPLAEDFVQSSSLERERFFLDSRESLEGESSSESWLDKDVLGTYHCEELGDLKIYKEDFLYHAQFQDWRSELRPVFGKQKMFKLTSAPWGGGIFDLKFLVKRNGRMLTLSIEGMNYRFKKTRSPESI